MKTNRLGSATILACVAGTVAAVHAAPDDSPWRSVRWQNADADRLATAARLELDAVARADLWRQLHALAHDEQPAALIVHPVASVLVRKDLRDFVPGAYGLRPEWAWVPAPLQRR